MSELINQGGPLVFILLGCSLLAVGIFLERFFHFHRANVGVQDLLQGLANLIHKKNFAEALHVCAGTPGPVARVVHAAIVRHEAPRSELKEIVQEAGQLEVPKLERYLPALMAIAYVAPLIGLLGSVLGLIDAFHPVTSSGFASSRELAGGVYRSLVTGAVGMAVAIPSYILYAYLATAVKTLMHDMERAGIEIVNLLTESRQNREIVDFKESALRMAEDQRKKKAAGGTTPAK
ncbi:MAG: MotA/TolQ/ExbB proton channel family protein [Verrucomicrobiales bacterium]|nr:MotA/TolQ/ExbB proton channel family protein [Verrucomicrobiales bacterium]